MRDRDNRHAVPEPSVYLFPAVAAGLAAAIVGGIAWGLITKSTDREIGIVAWGIGFIAGTAVVFATRGAKGPRLQAIAVVSALAGILLGKYLGYAFASQKSTSARLFSGDMFGYFRADLDRIFGLFDLLWVGFAVVTAWRIPQVVAAEPATTD